MGRRPQKAGEQERGLTALKPGSSNRRRGRPPRDCASTGEAGVEGRNQPPGGGVPDPQTPAHVRSSSPSVWTRNPACSSHSEEGRSVHRGLPGVKGAGGAPCREGRAGRLMSLCHCAEQEPLCLRGPGGHLSGFYLSLWQAEGAPGSPLAS